ncbi:hypothetical protein X801_07552, partial [Opisthorchis viverrini]
EAYLLEPWGTLHYDKLSVASSYKLRRPLTVDSQLRRLGPSTQRFGPLRRTNQLEVRALTCGKYVNKPQLKSLYAQAIAEAQRQKTSLLNALNKVSQIHQVEHEMRLALGPRNFRRGVLMSVLQENAKSIPMWVGKSGEKAPPLCGSIPASASTTAQAGDQVAALVPEPDVAATAACNLSEGCILAEVVSYDAEKRTYQVEDVDAEEGKVRYTLPRSKVIPLPKWKANPVTNPEAIFPKG